MIFAINHLTSNGEDEARKLSWEQNFFRSIQAPLRLKIIGKGGNCEKGFVS
jgi:hypothetical protein